MAYDSRNEIGALYSGDVVYYQSTGNSTYWYVYSPKYGRYGYVNRNYLAGAGGGIEMLGRYNAFSWSALPGYGWTGITIAILAGNNPYMVPLAAFFMAYLSKGCDLMATYAKVPAQLISIVQGVIFLFFAADQFLSGYKQKLVVQSAQEEIARENAMKAQEG